MDNIENLRDTIIPKSDQLNAEQLLAGPLTVTVTEVRRGDADQPVIVHYADDGGRPYKPCKTMRKALIFAWGEDGRAWVGRSMTLYNRPDVKFGGVAVGGIRISHLSHIERDIVLHLTATKGKKEPQTIKRLVLADPMEAHRNALHEAASQGMAQLESAFRSLPKPAQKALAGEVPALKQKAASVAAPEPEKVPEPAADDGGVF